MSDSTSAGVFVSLKTAHAPPAGRIEWLDCAKGVAIFLVVFGHVVGGANYRQWFEDRQFWLNLYDYIYLFHMPLFFFISGVLGIETMRQRPRHDVMSGLRGLVWPLLLWGSVEMILEPLLHRFTLRANEPITIKISGFFTGQVLYFLWTLFVIKLLLLPLVRLPLVWLLFASLAGYVWNAGYSLAGVWALAVRYLPFFLTGAMLSERVQALSMAANRRQASLRLSVATGLFALLGLVLVALSEWPQLQLLIGGMIGSAAVTCLVLSVRNGIVWRVLARLGVASLAIYVLHRYFQGATREVLLRWLPLSPLLMVTAITVAAVVGPLMVWEIAQRYGMTWLFRLPRPQSPQLTPDPPSRTTA